jgi:SAM-dependent methyltransferase
MEQQRIWSHFQNRHLEIFAQAVPRHRFLAAKAGRSRVLNIGLGDGGVERLARAMGADVHSLDPDGEAMSRYGELTKGVAGSVAAMPFADRSFDTVVSSEVFEHLDDHVLRSGLDEIRRVLRPGGVLIGTVPADEILADSEVLCPCCGTLFHRWGHVQSFSADGLREILSRVGIPMVERRMFVHWAGLNWRGKAAACLRLLMMAGGLRVSGHNFYFAVYKDALGSCPS